ncbi:unnamed protein product [Brachionus calyciflorus]|uniref:Uncharacterized protein n=1 Tax=Brachionus calyciflorus TaxID=104777 RepID=A0A814HRF2_9BILA|nr:unnamed protein product [Brachionus calyciflorus]
MSVSKNILVLMIVYVYVSHVITYPMSSSNDEDENNSHSSSEIRNHVYNKEELKLLRNLMTILKKSERFSDSSNGDDSKRDIADYFFPKRSGNGSAKRGMKGVALGFGK